MPTIDYVAHVRPHEESHSDADIAAFCSALCRRPLKCADVITLCDAAGVVTFDFDTGKYGGTLFTVLRGIGTDLALWFLRHVWINKAETITLDGSASEVPGIDSFSIVKGFGELASQVVEGQPAFAGLRAKLVEAAGGFVYEGTVTEQMVVDAREAYEAAEAAREAKEALKEQYDQLFNQHVAAAMLAGDADAVATGLRAVADAIAEV